MHKALGEVQDALEAQEQMIEDLRTDTGDEQQACPDPTPLPTDPTSREPLSS